MRVICKTNQSGDRDLQLNVGQSYLVIEVLIEGPEAATQFRLAGDGQGVPGLYEANWFEVTDASLPPNWAFNQNDTDGCYVLGPRSFAQPGYWELYFDSDPTARAIFATEVAVMNDA